ncbi:P-loop containing nucleoside triphosphate hydrolase protein [Gymnopus androsaceus JB14]|uniref:P-loop containing nucleoside triphosphate hydrolase protein n=1 Tax=Gymnopus androsaceus JB14 TaxID=1447944 RepID=A0A6A4IET6_9AGAR|nr:P-loop containing nucleoside triphosphate hydrolase protein [Gymnopus androsaceus JB14]
MQLYTSMRFLLKPPSTPPYWLILFASLHAFISFFNFCFSTLDSQPWLRTFDWIISALFVWIAGTLPLQKIPPGQRIASSNDIPTVALTCPEDNVTLWSWLTFTFVEPLFAVANKGTLNDTDVWSLSPYFKHKNLFNKYLEYRTTSNSLDLILDVVLELWTAVVGFVPSFALREILSVLADNTPEKRKIAFFWAFITFLAHLSFAQKDLIQQWHTRRCYERTRGQLFCAIHYKALKRQDVTGHVDVDGENKSADLGKIVNLMQGDSYAVSQRFWEFSAIIASPVRLIIALVFLYKQSWKAKDVRMGTVNELLQNIRFLKFYGWEYYWGGKTAERRESELSWRVKENVVDTAISFIWTWMPSATALVSFLSYTLIAGERLTVSTAFTAIALFSQLQEPMTALPGQFFAMLHAYVSMQRIEHYLAEEEVPEWVSAFSASAASSQPEPDGKIGFSNAIFEWQALPKTAPSDEGFQLGPMDFLFPSGKLSLVSGATGSGKSALLAALLGEMHCLSGRVQLDKSNHQVAYCAQNPWLEHATIRDNIIFGSSFGYDETRYQAVIEACALIRDLEIFEAGDLTEIGEKGITLSGGQRARIALARAIYSQAQVILLDDPLAAVDMHTAQHLVNNCLAGDLVRGRTVILVTHHIALCLPYFGFEEKVLQKVIEIEDEPFLSEDREDLPLPAQENEADALQSNVQTLREQPLLSKDGKLIEVEARAEGRVSLKTYITYIKAAGTMSWIVTFLLMLAIRFINIGNQVFLAAWGEAYEEKHPALLMISSISARIRYPMGRLSSPDDDVKPWLMVYFEISMAGAFCVLFYIALGYYASLQASRQLFVKLLNSIIRASSRWLDTTPIVILPYFRFTTDINTIDGALQNSARNCLAGILNFIASFLVILVVVPNFAPFALFIAWLYIRLAPPYIRTSRDLRRLESISLSPAFAGFDELLRGLVHIRAFGMEKRYQNNFYVKVDKFQSFDHAYWLVNCWLRWRYDCLGSVVVYATTLFALWMGVSSGWTAVVIIQAGIFAEASRQLVRVAAQLELDFNSVERVVEYLDIPQEAPAVIEDHRPPAYWPSSSGRLVVDNLSVKYAPSLPAVLKNLSFTIEPSEKIGVVGRTGSGKSTLALSILRMIEPAGGRIIIDGVDISTIGLEDLRTRITIVSQDVSLFSGTLRSNLDPMEEHSPEECLEVMKRCHLNSVLIHKENDENALLNLPMSQGSLSGGERQLVALARAILRGSNIMIMDEASSQIDNELDENIQKTIREELAGAIVITIAHRLKTIIEANKIMVLDKGEMVEYGTPRELLMKDGGVFREMCRMSPDWSIFEAVTRD